MLRYIPGEGHFVAAPVTLVAAVASALVSMALTLAVVAVTTDTHDCGHDEVYVVDSGECVGETDHASHGG